MFVGADGTESLTCMDSESEMFVVLPIEILSDNNIFKYYFISL